MSLAPPGDPGNLSLFWSGSIPLVSALALIFISNPTTCCWTRYIGGNWVDHLSKPYSKAQQESKLLVVPHIQCTGLRSYAHPRILCQLVEINCAFAVCGLEELDVDFSPEPLTDDSWRLATLVSISELRCHARTPVKGWDMLADVAMPMVDIAMPCCVGWWKGTKQPRWIRTIPTTRTV